MHGVPPETTLAQSASSAFSVLPRIAVLIVFVLIAGYVIMVMRKRLLSPRSDNPGARSLFEDLERMHASGDLTDEELAAAKRSIANKLAGRTDSDT